MRANGLKTFIVSGGGLDFMRPWTERVYGIPPEQVVGSALEIKCEERDGEPVIVRLPEFAFVDDKRASPSVSGGISGGGPSSPTGTPAATCKC